MWFRRVVSVMEVSPLRQLAGGEGGARPVRRDDTAEDRGALPLTSNWHGPPLPRGDAARDARALCRDLGHVPVVIEFELWRQREIELAKARGEDLFLPSDSPYRRRWGGWEAALRHFGFEPEEIEGRLEPGRERSNESLQRFQFGA
jgi:hypothetical protein